MMDEEVGGGRGMEWDEIKGIVKFKINSIN